MLFLHILFTLLSTWTILNMLIGVCVEVASATKERAIKEARWMSSSEKLTQAFIEIDEDRTRTISRKEFELMTQKPAVVKAFRDLQVEPRDLLEMSDALFAPDGEEFAEKELTFEEFLELIADNRPTKVASKLDVSYLRRGVRKTVVRMEGIIERLQFYATVVCPDETPGIALDIEKSALLAAANEARKMASEASNRLSEAQQKLFAILAERTDSCSDFGDESPQALRNDISCESINQNFSKAQTL